MEHHTGVLTAVIVNHRSNALVNACVRALLDGVRAPDEIIIVDNDGTGAAPDVGVGDARVRLITVGSNPGYAAACNLGTAAATGDRLLFLNADVTLSERCLERCLDALDADPSIGIVSPRLVRPDGRLDHACHRGIPSPTVSLLYKLRLHRLAPRSTTFARYTMGWLDPMTDHDIEACSGAFLLIDRGALDAVGGWDERYRFYAEDLDLCLRVGASGRRVRYLGTVTATHLKGALSHHETPDRALSSSQLAVKRWVQREIVASHRLFFDEHFRAETRLPIRLAIETVFTLQSLRIAAAERLAGA